MRLKGKAMTEMPPWNNAFSFEMKDSKIFQDVGALQIRLFGNSLNEIPHPLWEHFVFEPESKTDHRLIFARRDEFLFERCLYPENEYRGALYFDGIRKIWVVATKGRAINRFLIYTRDTINSGTGYREGPWCERFNKLSEKWIKEADDFDLEAEQKIIDDENSLFDAYINAI